MQNLSVASPFLFAGRRTTKQRKNKLRPTHSAGHRDGAAAEGGRRRVKSWDAGWGACRNDWVDRKTKAGGVACPHRGAASVFLCAAAQPHPHTHPFTPCLSTTSTPPSRYQGANDLDAKRRAAARRSTPPPPCAATAPTAARPAPHNASVTDSDPETPDSDVGGGGKLWAGAPAPPPRATHPPAPPAATPQPSSTPATTAPPPGWTQHYTGAGGRGPHHAGHHHGSHQCGSGAPGWWAVRGREREGR